ncbi:TM2 domain-containing protein [Rothia sp. ZJ932]|uniref:TM2 domain-containing protein n=1 Tax=Rothia sp. ZJ932 TaxID=2810516 RepID=UPI001F07A423|nr:TM2 domain-containing protein [Rothia sp. ZJ932]
MSQQPDHYIPTPITDQERASWGQSNVLWGATPQVVVRSKSLIVAYVLWFFLGGARYS